MQGALDDLGEIFGTSRVFARTAFFLDPRRTPIIDFQDVHSQLVICQAHRN